MISEKCGMRKWHSAFFDAEFIRKDKFYGVKGMNFKKQKMVENLFKKCDKTIE